MLRLRISMMEAQGSIAHYMNLATEFVDPRYQEQQE